MSNVTDVSELGQAEKSEVDDNNATSSPKVSDLFNDPTANAVFRTSDGTRFRVDDFFLKANRLVTDIHIDQEPEFLIPLTCLIDLLQRCL